MATLTLTNTHQSRFIAFVRKLVINTITEWRNQRQVEKTVAALSVLSDRELEDIGLARYQIEAVARASIKQ